MIMIEYPQFYNTRVVAKILEHNRRDHLEDLGKDGRNNIDLKETMWECVGWTHLAHILITMYRCT
jgi:hypothetical protein